MKHCKVFQPRLIRIVEIVFLSLFIISLFMPYAYGIKPKEYFWDIWSNHIALWRSFIFVGLPLILSFFLLLLKIGQFKFWKSVFYLIKWSAIIMYVIIMAWGLISDITDYVNDELFGNLTLIIISLLFSLFLLTLTLIKLKDKYLEIENYILSIISIPVVYFFPFSLFEFEFGGYLLSICFSVLYVIAVLKVFLLKDIEESHN
ncbi:MAG: hypothetical protein ABFS05_06800 [Bacteroidota bacterium]